MSKLGITIFFLFLVFSKNSSAQSDLLSNQLDELVIERYKISLQSKSQHNSVLNDSLITNTTGTFTDFLQKHTPIYFKENGYGMVSSPSFRGTTAQQTSVLWNGIKVNSNLLGQSDFNSTAFKSYDDIVVKPGGGSVLYGSGAIGGTIHLNNTLEFSKNFQNVLQLNYGSFNTQGLHYKLSYGNNKVALNAHIGYNHSDNDYEWIGKERKNINGAFHNVDFGTEIAYKINSKHKVEFYSASFSDERHFALITPYQTKTKYQNNFNRNLLKWNYKSNQFLNLFSVANIQEQFTYFDKLPTQSNSGGRTNLWYFKNESFYQLTRLLKLSSIFEYQLTLGEGDEANFSLSKQEIASVALMGTYQLNVASGFELGVKNEVAKDYENPFLFSAGYFYNKAHYQLKVNASKNYRIPTFNDLYWNPGGNLNLTPEKSYQFDVNNGLKFRKGHINLSTYYISIDDMIRWVPTNTGFWEAQNTHKVSIYGAEFNFGVHSKINMHTFSLSGNYAFTKSINNDNNKQLTYTPLHKANMQVQYQYKNFSVTPSYVHVGNVFTTSSNDKQSQIDGYGLLDLTLSQKIYWGKNRFTISFHMKNIVNKVYMSMPERLMPGRNYQFQIIKKF